MTAVEYLKSLDLTFEYSESESLEKIIESHFWQRVSFREEHSKIPDDEWKNIWLKELDKIKNMTAFEYTKYILNYEGDESLALDYLIKSHKEQREKTMKKVRDFLSTPEGQAWEHYVAGLTLNECIEFLGG